MSKHTRTVEENAAHNLKEFWEKGPGLRYSTRTWTVAVDTERGAVLHGGLGAMGVGEMWVAFPCHDPIGPGFADAPDRPGAALWFLDQPLVGDAEELKHWRTKAQAGELVRIRCKWDKKSLRHKKPPRPKHMSTECGLDHLVPDDRVPEACEYCEGPLRVTTP